MFRRGVTLASTYYPPVRHAVRTEDVPHHVRTMFRCGLIDDGAVPGTCSMMPAGQRVLTKITSLIDAEMHRAGAHRISLPLLVPESAMRTSGRWDDFGKSLFQLKDRNERALCLGPTHEEAITSLLASEIISHARLPVKLYQIENKFRDETHTGLLRCREFLMKDLYTFHTELEEAKETFKQLCDAYSRIFSALQLPCLQVAGDTGVMGGEMSREFQVPSDIGEDVVRICSKCGSAWNSEMASFQGPCEGGCTVEEKKTVEAGHCFLLGTKYSEAFGAKYRDTDNTATQHLVMGCYGIGISRLLAVLADVMFPEDMSRLVWPKAFAPFTVYVMSMGKPREERLSKARELAEMIDRGVYKDANTGTSHLLCQGDVYLDDRLDIGDMKRMKEADIRGSPYLVIVGKQSSDGIYELQHQPSQEKEYLNADALVERLGELVARDQGILT